MIKGAPIYYGILAGLPQSELRDRAGREAMANSAPRRRSHGGLALPRLRRSR